MQNTIRVVATAQHVRRLLAPSAVVARPLGDMVDAMYSWSLHRQEELESMGPEHRELKAAAAAIDARLKGLDERGRPSGAFRTLLHGDFKSANLLFSAGDVPICAAYDFQYCGMVLGSLRTLLAWG